MLPALEWRELITYRCWTANASPDGQNRHIPHLPDIWLFIERGMVGLYTVNDINVQRRLVTYWHGYEQRALFAIGWLRPVQ